MNAEARIQQDHAYSRTMAGQVIIHQPGLDLTVTWTPGYADQTREALDRAYQQLRAQITDGADA